MERRTVQLRVAGQTCRVVTTASDGDLDRFVAMLEDRLANLAGKGRPAAPHAMTLVALGLMHELEETRARAQEREQRAKEALARLLERIDVALAGEDGACAATTAPSPCGGNP